MITMLLLSIQERELAPKALWRGKYHFLHVAHVSYDLWPENLANVIINRLLDLEKSMNELKTILRGEKPVEHPINQGTQDDVQKPGADKPSGSENEIIPADHGIHIAPAEVVRQIGSQLSGGYRRLLDQANIDLIACQIMDENIANEHISL